MEKISNITCKKCFNTFSDNPNKHRYRPKYCSICRTAYRKPFSVFRKNFKWLKDKLFRRQQRTYNRQLRAYQRVLKSLRMSLGREPTHSELMGELYRKIIIGDEEKQAYYKLATRKTDK